jgi:hypothetical protein
MRRIAKAPALLRPTNSITPLGARAKPSRVAKSPWDVGRVVAGRSTSPAGGILTKSRLYTDSAGSYRALKGYLHEYVNHTQKEYARGDVHENRAECLFSLLKPYLQVFRGISKTNLPGYLSFFQFLWNVRQRNAFQQAELILHAALDPTVASKARKGQFVKCMDHFDLLQTAIN